MALPTRRLCFFLSPLHFHSRLVSPRFLGALHALSFRSRPCHMSSRLQPQCVPFLFMCSFLNAAPWRHGVVIACAAATRTSARPRASVRRRVCSTFSRSCASKCLMLVLAKTSWVDAKRTRTLLRCVPCVRGVPAPFLCSCGCYRVNANR